MVTHLAAANDYQLSHLQSPKIWSQIQAAEVFFVGGYHLTVCPEAAIALAKEAASANKIFMLSLSAPFIPQFFKQQVDDTAPYWDYVVGNESEARSYAASHDLGTEDVTVIARKMVDLPGKVNGKRKRVAIITQGTEETVVAIQGEENVKLYPIRPIAERDIVDTNGAGDAFTGGFLAGIVEGKSIDESVDMGHWLAGLSIRELGPRFVFPPPSYHPLFLKRENVGFREMMMLL